jgi:hypothetical protein
MDGAIDGVSSMVMGSMVSSSRWDKAMDSFLLTSFSRDEVSEILMGLSAVGDSNSRVCTSNRVVSTWIDM